MERARSAAAALAAFALAVAGPATAVAAQRFDPAEIERVLLAEMAETRAPGASIALVEDGRIVFARGYGVASAEEPTPVDGETLFRIGSTSKIFTGLAVARLAAEGRLRTDAPIGRDWPELAGPVGSLTLHQLLGHTAGLIALPAGDGPHDDHALQDRALRWGEEMLFTDPDDVFSYSSPGYWLAGAVVERVTGMPFADAIDSLVLRPAGMVRSTFRPLRAMTYPRAQDHRVTAQGAAEVIRPFPDDASTWPGGSLFASARELALFATALLAPGTGERGLPAEAVALASSAHAPIPGSECAYAYGLTRCTRSGLVTLSHYGFRGGSGSILTLVPARGAAIVVLANRAGGIFTRTEQAALRQLGVAPEEGDAAPLRPLSRAERARVLGVFAAGGDSLHLAEEEGAVVLTARGATYTVSTRADPDGVPVVLRDDEGAIVQEFLLVTGRGGASTYLHDGLNAFRRVAGGDRGAPPRRPTGAPRRPRDASPPLSSLHPRPLPGRPAGTAS